MVNPEVAMVDASKGEARRLGGRCRAHVCPDGDLDGERAFCSWHWDLMPQALREWLCDAYGTRRWPDVLSECIRALRQIEAEAR